MPPSDGPQRPISMRLLSALALAAALAACATQTTPPASQAALDLDPAVADTLVLAGGCFWCMEKPFETIDGVASVVSGFAGGPEVNPTYDDVASKRTGHYEVVQVIYDGTRVGIDELLRTYWHNVDPLDGDGQFCDRGTPYRPAIFAPSAEVRALAEQQKAALTERFGSPVAVEIKGDDPFYPAEAYHQDFYRTNPARYTSYRTGCRRDARLAELWGDAAGHATDAL